ncbi:MAG: RNA polymerase sigma-70 factor [Chitinophagaceae bacterium]|nr:RNA polymerase sigma-70 factor [Chitinophagaceae bacterium]
MNVNDTMVFEQLFREYYPSLCLYADRYLSDPEAAKDIAEDAFVKLWTQEQPIDPGKVKSWLYTTTRNACLDLLRRNKVRRKNSQILAFLSQAETEDFHLQEMIRAEMLEQLYKALQQLPEQCRIIFSKLYIEGKAMDEAAEELNLSINTIKSQKARGLRLLRSKFSLDIG